MFEVTPRKELIIIIIIIIYVMELGHLLTHSGLAYPEVSSRSATIPSASWRSVSLPWVIYYSSQPISEVDRVVYVNQMQPVLYHPYYVYVLVKCFQLKTLCKESSNHRREQQAYRAGH